MTPESKEPHVWTIPAAYLWKPTEFNISYRIAIPEPPEMPAKRLTRKERRAHLQWPSDWQSYPTPDGRGRTEGKPDKGPFDPGPLDAHQRQLLLNVLEAK